MSGPFPRKLAEPLGRSQFPGLVGGEGRPEPLPTPWWSQEHSLTRTSLPFGDTHSHPSTQGRQDVEPRAGCTDGTQIGLDHPRPGPVCLPEAEHKTCGISLCLSQGLNRFTRGWLGSTHIRQPWGTLSQQLSCSPREGTWSCRIFHAQSHSYKHQGSVWWPRGPGSSPHPSPAGQRHYPPQWLPGPQNWALGGGSCPHPC